MRVLLVVVISVILFKFVLVPIRVTGDSMLPTYRNGQIRFVNKLAFLRSTPERGDVVAVEFAGKEVLLLKRVIALPGETFQVQNGDVFINGQPLSEPYAKGKIPSLSGKPGSSSAIPLGPSEYMVVGDNRRISEGYIKDAKQILGKIL